MYIMYVYSYTYHIRLYGAFHTPSPISVIMNMGGPVPFLGVVAQQSWYNIMWNILIILSSTIWDNSGRGKFILTLSICTHREHLRIEHFQPGKCRPLENILCVIQL